VSVAAHGPEDAIWIMDNLAFEMARGGIVDSHGGTANAQKNKALARAHERGGLAMWNGIGY